MLTSRCVPQVATEPRWSAALRNSRSMREGNGSTVDTPPSFAKPRGGGLSEWFKEPDSKSGVPARVPWVRIPCPPPQSHSCRRLHADWIWRTGRDDRAVEGARLEIVCAATYRGFESLSLRNDEF